jgi:hypothetical protein
MRVFGGPSHQGLDHRILLPGPEANQQTGETLCRERLGDGHADGYSLESCALELRIIIWTPYELRKTAQANATQTAPPCTNTN